MNHYFPDDIAYLTGKLSDHSTPPAITAPDGGGKFDHDGNALPWPGNTIICHVETNSPEHKTLTHIQEQLKAGQHADAFIFLPSNSFHMTLFEGISNTSEKNSNWPKDLEIDVDLETGTNILLKRLKGLA